MSKDNLNDENYGVRDKRGHWKPFGTIAINPPTSIFYNPVKMIKYFFKYPGIFFPWTFVFGAITVATYSFLTPSLETMKTLEVGWIAFIFFRIFDIWKPFPISYFDKNFKNGFGIVLDDLIAGVLAIIPAMFLIYLGFF